jgi:hypothetical protein
VITYVAEYVIDQTKINVLERHARATRASQVVEPDADRSPFLTRPGDLADLLLSYRQGSGPARFKACP